MFMSIFAIITPIFIVIKFNTWLLGEAEIKLYYLGQLVLACTATGLVRCKQKQLIAITFTCTKF